MQSEEKETFLTKQMHPPLRDADPVPDPLNPLSAIPEEIHGDITEGEEGGGTSGLGNKERRVCRLSSKKRGGTMVSTFFLRLVTLRAARR
ncbi:MAG: hypothetical protein ACXVBE_13275 [Bdellovibrionota bacterium]